VLDLNLLKSIGKPRYTIVCPPGCHLNCTLPYTQAKYLCLLDQYVKGHHFLPKLDNYLFLLAKDPSTSKATMQASLESFDHLKMESMKHAKKNCCHFHTRTVQYSPDLNICRNHQDLWWLVLCWYCSFHIKAWYICQLAAICLVQDPLSASEAQATRASL